MRFYVVGGGWSTDEMDIDSFTGDGKVIACNSGVLNCTPDYFFFCDGLIHKMDYFKKIKCPVITTPYTGYKGADRYFEKRENRKDWSLDTRDGKLLFGTDVVHPAIHLAYYLGASEVVLLGCDGEWKHGERNNSNAHLIDGRRIRINDVRTGNSDMELVTGINSHRQIRKNNPDHKIYNASLGKGLDGIYPRIICSIS